MFTGARQRPAARERSRRWDYDGRNNLIREEQNDNPFTWRQWQYDAAGRLLKQDGAQPDHEQWRWDAASNPLDEGVNAVPHNRVAKLNGTEYSYDVHGHTVEKHVKASAGASATTVNIASAKWYAKRVMVLRATSASATIC